MTISIEFKKFGEKLCELVATILFAPLSFAQDNSDLDDEEIEEVVVTGSKLGRSNFEADVPILTTNKHSSQFSFIFNIKTL